MISVPRSVALIGGLHGLRCLEANVLAIRRASHPGESLVIHPAV